MDSKADQNGFYYDFIFPQFSPSYLEVIEQKMKQICREGISITTSQMVYESALGYLDHIGHLERKKKVKQSQEIYFVHIGSFIDLSTSLHLENTSELMFFSLVDTESLGYERVRIFGNAFFDKKDLKEFEKNFKSYSKTNHLQAGEDLGFFKKIEEGLVMLPKGLFLKDLLMNYWKEQLVKENFSFIQTFLTSGNKAKALSGLQNFDFQKFAETTFYRKGEPFTSLLDPNQGFKSNEVMIFKEKDLNKNCISFLQLIDKTLTIFGFRTPLYCLCVPLRGAQRESTALKNAFEEIKLECQTIKSSSIKSPEVVVLIEDGLKRFWKVSKFTLVKEDTYWAVDGNGICSFERVIALLLEVSKGELPLYLLPEQLRLFPLCEKDLEWVEKILKSFQEKKIRVYVDKRFDLSLKKRIFLAENERVPYLAFVGEHERNKGLLSVRSFGKTKQEQIGVLELIEKLEVETNCKKV